MSIFNIRNESKVRKTRFPKLRLKSPGPKRERHPYHPRASFDYESYVTAHVDRSSPEENAYGRRLAEGFREMYAKDEED